MTTTPLAALQQHAPASLQPGEEYVAAIRVETPTYDRASRNAMMGVTAGLLLAAHDQHKAQHESAIALSGAGGFIGVTGSRVLVFAVGLGFHPNEQLGAVDREGLTLDSEPFRQGIVKRARVHLLDGDRTIVDAVCSAKNPDLEQLRSLIPPAS